MARIVLRAHLYIDSPGSALAALTALATFRRTGRLRGHQRRVISYWRWDAQSRQLILPRGLLPAVRRVLPDAPILDQRFLAPRIALGFRGTLRDYQAAMVEALGQREGGVMVMPPAAGKTRTALALAAHWQQPTLFLVHQLRLADKTRHDARHLLTLPRRGLGYIVGGRPEIGTHLTVATIQTLANKPRLVRTLTQRVGTVIVDECHHVSADSYKRVVSAFPARFRLGLSATPERDDGLGPMVTAIMGAPIKVSREYLGTQGVLIDPLIYLVPTGWEGPPEDLPFHERDELRAMDLARNILIIRLTALARRQGQRVLILVERTKHATVLAQILSKAGIAAHPVYGELPKPLQDQRFTWMEQGQAVVVATKLANEGLDWPVLDCLILATPGRSPTVLEQRTGRVARTAAGKTMAVVYDLVDAHPLYQVQMAARLEKYQEMDYRVRRFKWPQN